MESTTLGRGGPVVSRMGLGMMGMSGIYGPADDSESIATIRAAIDAGITLLDTGDFYGMGHNEMLLGSALREVPRDSVFVQVKFGAQRDPAGGFVGHDASPAAVKTSLAYSLRRLGTDYVDLYQPARLDPNVPIEDIVGAIAEMITAGYVRYAGLSEMGAETIRRAQAVHPIAALQIEYSLMSRASKVRCCRSSASRGSRSRPTACCPAACSARRLRGSLARPTHASASPGSVSRIWRRTWAWSPPWSRSPRNEGPPRRNWPSPGSSHAAATSSRSLAPNAGIASPRRSGRSN